MFRHLLVILVSVWVQFSVRLFLGNIWSIGFWERRQESWETKGIGGRWCKKGSLFPSIRTKVGVGPMGPSRSPVGAQKPPSTVQCALHLLHCCPILILAININLYQLIKLHYLNHFVRNYFLEIRKVTFLESPLNVGGRKKKEWNN